MSTAKGLGVKAWAVLTIGLMLLSSFGGFKYAEATLPTQDGTWGGWFRDTYMWVTTALHLDYLTTSGGVLYGNSGDNVTQSTIVTVDSTGLDSSQWVNSTVGMSTSALYANSTMVWNGTAYENVTETLIYAESEADYIIWGEPAAAPTMYYAKNGRNGATISSNSDFSTLINSLTITNKKVFITAGDYTANYPIIKSSYTNIEGAGIQTTKITGNMPDILIENGEDVWDENISVGVTSVVDLVNFKAGAGSASISPDATVAANTILATEQIASTSINAQHRLVIWLKSSVATVYGDLQILLDDSANCASPIESINVPPLQANVWTFYDLNLTNMTSLTNVVSIGLKQVTDIGAATINVDAVIARNFVFIFEKNGGEAIDITLSSLTILGAATSGGGVLLNSVKLSHFKELQIDNFVGEAFVADGGLYGTYYNYYYDFDLRHSYIGILSEARSSGANGLQLFGGDIRSNSYNLMLAGTDNNVYGVTIELGTVASIYTTSNLNVFGGRIEDVAAKIYLSSTGYLNLFGTYLNGFAHLAGSASQNVMYQTSSQIWLIKKIGSTRYTNNYATLQAAINDSSQGDTISIPAGTYNEALLLTSVSNRIFIGAGMAQTIINGGTTGNALTLSGSSYNTFLDIQFKTEAGAGNNYDAIQITSTSQYNYFERIKISESDRYGIGINYTTGTKYHNTFNEIYIDSTDNYGIAFFGTQPAAEFQFSNIYITTTGDVALYIDKCYRSTFSNIIVKGMTGVNKNAITATANCVNCTFSGLSLLPTGSGLPYSDLGSGNKWGIPAGYTYSNSGTATILNATTSIAFAHGLSATPLASWFSITFTENPTNPTGNWWLTCNATHATLNVAADPGASNLDFSWQARRP